MKFSTLCKLSHFFVIRCLSSKFLCSTNHIQSLSVQEKFQPVSGNVSRYLANKSTELESSTTSQHEPPAGGGSSPSPLPDPENAEQTSGHTVSTAMNEASASEPARPAMKTRSRTKRCILLIIRCAISLSILQTSCSICSIIAVNSIERNP